MNTYSHWAIIKLLNPASILCLHGRKMEMMELIKNLDNRNQEAKSFQMRF